MNELINETSPYLLQHAANPVHWKAWNANSLATAKNEDKLIIISVGYSACHWCHVMEHDSFEDVEAAAVMNEHFISIKVDREERPDVDAVYMKAVQLMGGNGGWPLNIVALPDGRPVWGGTYFPKKDWIDYLEQLAAMYKNEPDKLLEYAGRLHNGIQSVSAVQMKESPAASQDLLPPLIKKWKRNFDHDFGGMARSPKFMMPNNYQFMLRYATEKNDTKLLDFVNLTLTKMAYGGLFDTVGGGFSRYSVDMKWHVPHFEKMLYDNAQLVSLYSEAYKVSANPLYKEIVQKTTKFVISELGNGRGGFYSALDADSLDASGKLEEGAFYVWTIADLQRIIGTDFELFSEVFNINDFGYWEKGHYVLIQNRPTAEIAAKNNLSETELHARKIEWEHSLFSEREKRNKPRLDDKCLTSWNAMMGKGFVDAYKAFGDQSYLDMAVANADFIIGECLSTEGNLFHSYKAGRSTINGYLEDYAHLIDLVIALYQVSFEEKWLQTAKSLTDHCFQEFYDQSGFFTFTSKRDQPLIAQHFETEDNVIPASNSVMAGNLLTLGVLYSETHYEETAKKMINSIVTDVDYPPAFSNWLLQFMRLSDANRELAICGPDAVQMAAVLHQQYLPHVLIAGTTSDSNLPFLSNRFEAGKNLFYICRNKTCQLPVETMEEAVEQLKINAVF
ncbi:MAG: thioredoxin domain-containing protein [Flavobacterium sp.]|nr:thioredoxin domain-containing protein [Flavobacterium sp.]